MVEVSEGMDKILEFLSKKPNTVHQIVCKTGIHNRTVKKYLKIIEKIQNAPKLKKEMKGLRVYLKLG